MKTLILLMILIKKKYLKHIPITRFLYVVLMLLLYVNIIQCKKENHIVDNAQLKQIDNLNTKAFSLIRGKEWEASFAMAKTSESLATKLHYQKGQAKSLRAQAYYWNNKGQSANAFQALQHSERIEESIKNYKGLLAVYNAKALLKKKSELYDDALINYKKALALTDTSISKKQRSRTHINIANVYTKKGVYDTAVYHYERSLLLNKDNVNNRQTKLTYMNLGNVYSLTFDYKSAEHYYTKALEEYKKEGDSFKIASIYNNLGALFFEKGDDTVSLDYLKKSVALKEKIGDTYGDTYELASNYVNIAELYVDINPKLSLNYLQKAETLLIDEYDAFVKAKVHITRVGIYQNQHQISKAKKELNQALLLSKNTEKLTIKRYLAKKQAELAESEGNYKKAYECRLQYEILNDSIFNEEKLWGISENQKSTQTEFNKIEVNDLEKDKELAEAKAKSEQEENKKLYAYLIAFGIILILSLIIAFYFYKLRKASNQLAQQQELLLKGRIQNLVNDQEIQIINATLEAREKEKAAISKELHNNIGSLLTSVKFHFQAFDEEVFETDDATKKLYGKTASIIDNITEEVRLLSHRFDQDPIPDFNLKTAIETFSKKVENNKLKVHTAIHGLDSFQNSQVSIYIFRILQELVNNAIKHAEASQLTIYVTHNMDTINIMVEDNGKGFDTIDKNKGIGLKNLQKQLMEIDGTCDIDSDLTRGTTVNIDIPVT